MNDIYFDAAIGKITGQNVLMWLAVTAAVGTVCLVLVKTGRMKRSTAVLITLLAFYLAFAFTITLVNRVPRKSVRYNLTVFWTIEAIRKGKTVLAWEIFWNVVLFIPLGMLLSALYRRGRQWLAAVTGILLSTGIELMQLVLRRGLFEFDDIIYNSAGCLIGILLVQAVRRIKGEEDGR